MIRVLKFLPLVLFAAVMAGGALWSATAFWFHLSDAALLIGWCVLGLAVLAAVLSHRKSRRAGWAVAVVTGLFVAGWYQTIVPLQSRDWADEVSRGVTARVEGSKVILNNIRDFDWSSPSQAKPRWISHTYDLDQLQSADMFTSVWSNPDIAHLLVSFGFANGEHIVFSAEIRREKQEAFNEIGGFFRQFELVLIGATERDIIKLRTNYRREEVRLYPLTLGPEARKAMFLSFVELSQKLEKEPAFYNTLTANCTTVVYQLAKALQPDLPMDWRLVLSAHLPEYLLNLGLLGGEGTVDDRKEAALISGRALSAPEGADFSRVIRNQ
ncbi:DUF4105 domain-containing protein [Roseibium litorale]|uniref:DUF4105 domain-containing protein n=1 Tax=Roseibium litorale TaxID=2803841 RepID=A0ABR9CJ28_9HYPH|nr:DUF4105 domain-containing protein [Roseibium litorale]MBD8890395.1 DUF4105 domain-containing protein [Roseibium litorale]